MTGDEFDHRRTAAMRTADRLGPLDLHAAPSAWRGGRRTSTLMALVIITALAAVAFVGFAVAAYQGG